MNDPYFFKLHWGKKLEQLVIKLVAAIWLVEKITIWSYPSVSTGDFEQVNVNWEVKFLLKFFLFFC